MTFQPFPNGCEAVWDFIISGKATANRMCFTAAEGFAQADLNALATALDGVIGTYLLTYFSETMQYVGCRVKALRTDNDLSASSTAGSFAGSQTDVQMPNNVSLCLTLKSNFTGRSARGRFYMQPPLTGHMVGPNQVSTTYINNAVAMVNAIRSASAGQGFNGVICSRYANKVKRETAVAFAISSVVARNSRTDSQRNRLPTPD